MSTLTAASPSSATLPTLIETLWPAARTRLARQLLLVLAGTALLALSARVQVPFWPVPMTMQTFAVLVIGMAYGARLGAVTVLAYLLEGAFGLPVFASGAGLAYFAGPTAGYLFGFVAAAWVVGALAGRGFDRSPWLTLVAMTLGTALIFVFGVTWLSVFLGDLSGGISAGLLPFAPAALFKIVLAAVVLPGAWRLAGRD